MHSNWTRGIVASLLTLWVGSCFAPCTWAQTTPQPGAKTGERVELVKELHAAHKLLAEGDHDYAGHRARAAEEVHRAIREVEGYRRQMKAQAAAPTTTTPGGASNKATKGKSATLREPQQTSDAQLNRALGILQSVHAELGAHHPRAAANVTAAIAEIKTALSIK